MIVHYVCLQFKISHKRRKHVLCTPSPPPFLLLLQGDKLYGRGTTDCLGHVALITELFIQLAQKKPKLKYSVVAVFIAA